MDVVRCKTVEGVGKELAMSALVYNLVRLVMLEASRRQRVRVERISLVDTARWLAQAMEYGAVPPLKLRVSPHRPNRAETQAQGVRPAQQTTPGNAGTTGKCGQRSLTLCHSGQAPF